MNDRECPRPNCGTMIGRDVYACRAHWFALPPRIRASIMAAWQKYKRDPLANVDALLDAQAEAESWWMR
jgi:hypothetical protein